MIDFSVNIQPCSYKNECGDFYLCEEFEEFYLIGVGDIGGHGSHNIFDIANETKELILKNSELEIGKIFEIIHTKKDIKRVGAVLFIAKIFKNLQILKYAQLGNLKGQFIREQKITDLYFQDGILGFNIPQSIKTNILKIQKGDIFIISTDGLSIHNSKLQTILGQTSTHDIAEFCINNFAKNNDDGMCFVLKYENITMGDNLPHTPYINTPNYEKSIKERNDTQKTKDLKDFTTTIVKLQEEDHFVTLKNQYAIKEDLKKILNFCDLSKVEHTKFITFVVEMLTSQHNSIEVYLSKNIFQVFVVIDKRFLSIVEHLFYRYFVETLSKQKVLVVLEFRLQEKFINTQFLDDLQHELKLGLDSEAYKRYKENQQIQTMLSEQSKLASMGEMIGNIAHQWRQPLSIISTASTGLMFQIEYGMELHNENVLETLNKINDNAQYLSKTIDDFRNFIKHDNPKENFKLSDIIDKTLTLVKPALKDKHIKLITNETPDCILDGYPNEVIQSLINIINNAKDVILERGKEKLIFLTSNFVDGDRICIEITDCGGGIPQEIVDKIFEPYFTTKHQAQGTGIGLYMTRQIIVDHNNGKIEVENKKFEHHGYEYFGASFKIYFEVV